MATGLARRNTVLGQLMAVDARQQSGAVPDIEDALTQERTQGASFRWVDVSGRDEIGTKQVREFLRVDAIVLVLAAVNGFDVEGVGQDEGDVRLVTLIGQPVPTEHAFAADGQVVAVRSDQLEEKVEVVVLDVGVDQLFALVIHDADVHLTGVQINSAVELGGGCVVLHG
jgi:hypothetical protein